ncbi:heme biosynthesis protein HemY [Pelagibius litoralis]|uniref:Heme biosynthesis protein HemY n=1 Tax=Pelagibius litoralis TaxID=374515 RepID=A0A967F0Y4_9PROT|nr:heme biosynthesis HemY N-terminal domain-containing protein [Pelagibius litoralis]NIA71049.1 heme biosynthesis protein HemY [Pelagibius litoralis]
MRRAIVFVVLAALAALAAFWLAEHPGSVSIEWLGYRMEPPVGLLVLAGVVLSISVIIVYRIITLILGTPGSIGRAFASGRRKRGFRALSQGMVAVAAGDAQEAARWARKADSLLEDPPLTLLLSAQAAQLGGDEQAAEKYFNAMLEKPETRFLGLRGLLMQALRSGDDQRALGYVREAHALRPKTPWVVTNLFELSERTGDYDAAAGALKQAAKIKALPKPDADHKGAVITLAKAEKALAEERRDEAFSLARAADKADPDLLAAAALHARLAVESGRFREAAKVVERSWPRTPSAELAGLYRRAAPAAKPLEQVKRFTKLAALNPDHRESHLALAEASLEAKLWGEARRHLGILVTLEGEDPARAQVCRLMARLEEAEHNDSEAARAWLEQAAHAPRDPAWVCNACGAVAAQWSVDCGACGAFDSLAWRAPRRVGTLGAADAGSWGSALARITARHPVKTAEAPVGIPLAPLPDQPPLPDCAPAEPSKPAPQPSAGAALPAAKPAPPVSLTPAASKPAPAGPNGQQPPESSPEDDDPDEASAVEGSVPPRP